MRSKEELMKELFGYNSDGDFDRACLANECVLIETLIDIRDCLVAIAVSTQAVKNDGDDAEAVVREPAAFADPETVELWLSRMHNRHRR